MAHINRTGPTRFIALLSCSLILPSAHAAFTTFSSPGLTAAAITPTRDAFRTAVGGGTVPATNGGFGGLRREINWDGVPDTSADPNVLTGGFFAARGAILATPGTALSVSAAASTATPILFGFPGDFATFSPQRLFTAINSNITNVTFVIPGTATPAVTSAFGAVFVDVETAGSSKLEFFDINDVLLYTQNVEVAGNQGLSFLGAVATAGEQIVRVRITAGLNTIVSSGTLGNPNDDVAALDDFLYAEPVAIPEPSTILAATPAIALLRRRR